MLAGSWPGLEDVLKNHEYHPDAQVTTHRDKEAPWGAPGHSYGFNARRGSIFHDISLFSLLFIVFHYFFIVLHCFHGFHGFVLFSWLVKELDLKEFDFKELNFKKLDFKKLGT
jgi:hypothetical protein